MKVGDGTIFTKTLLILGLIQLLIKQAHGFDLVSALLSQNSDFSLNQLKSMLSSEAFQKALGARGLLPSMEVLRGGDPAQIQKLLSKLRPSQGRLDPQILQLLASAFGGKVRPQSPPVKNHQTRPPRNKFSSKFRRRRPGAARTTSPTPIPSSTIHLTENPDEALQFGHVSDPNIRNHKLFGWRDQNFTTIDQAEDLMMEESIPAFIPLSPDLTEDGENPTKPGHWEYPSTTESAEELPERKFTRAPLEKHTLGNHPISSHFHPPESTKSYFRPSPVDPQMPLRRFEPTETFHPPRNPGKPPLNSHLPVHPASNLRRPQRRPPYVMNTNLKQDRILSVGEPTGQAHAQFPSKASTRPGPTRMQAQESNLNYRYSKPAHFPGKNYKGYPNHPFAHYVDRNTMYSPSNYHHNKYHYHNPWAETQSIASEKVDNSWSPTLFLLGGIVAASALAAFVLPSLFQGTAGVGKEGEGGAAEKADFWNEVKGLYSDLAHLAKGDLSHFDKSEGSKIIGEWGDDDGSYSTEDGSLIRRNDLELEDYSDELEVKPHRRVRLRGKGKIDKEALASPVLTTQSPTSGSTVFGTTPSYGPVSTDWVKLQLRVIE